MAESTYQIFTFLGREDAEQLGGIPPRAIVGSVDTRVQGDEKWPLTPDTFRPNPLFREFLHEVLSQSVFLVDALLVKARQIGNGWVYIVDGRTADPAGEVPSQDIVGGVQARDGALVPGSYWANPDHHIVSERGLFKLPAELQSLLLDAMRSLPPVTSPGMRPD